MIAKKSLATLYENCVMAQLVWRDFDDEFTGKVGDTVTIRKPPVFTAHEYNRADGIIIQDATETGIPVVLNHLADVSFAVTSEERTLELRDFSETFIDPAMEALAQKIDSDLLALRSDVVHEVGTVSGELWSNPRSLIAAGRVLTQNKVPKSGRSAVVGPVTGAEWLKDDLLNRADARGDTLGLQEASLGRRLFGFDPYETNHIVVPPVASGNSTTEENIGFHRTAFALVTRPLALPQGAQNAVVVSYKGFGLRLVIDYNINLKSDIVSIDFLYGTKTIDADRAVLIKGTDTP